jgi:CDP-glycerol glycerophosphotransferase
VPGQQGRPGRPESPDVTVVVIAFNDRANIPNAIRSVTEQTLRNLEVVVVDDASTDGTADAAEAAAAEDPRVRVVRLPENSGGCSRPRNVGIEHARAPYVMFLDSDDLLERHACKNLLVEAERTGADVVAGEVLQLLLDRGKEKLWVPELFTRRATYAGLREKPHLFFDPLSTNKIYRRAFLDEHDIRFPEGVVYEDSLFSTKVYTKASSIAVIPNVVYHWRMVERAETKSITQRRSEFALFRDRIAVHRMMDRYLAENDHGDLIVEKNFKFVRHDLRLYLRDLPHRDADYQRRFLELAADYLATVSDESLAMLEPVERICVFMIMRLDIEETLRTVDYLRHDYKLSTRLVERDGRVYWSGAYLDTEQDRAVMDVTELGLHRMPFERQSLFNEVTEISVRGRRLRLVGRVLVQPGSITEGDQVALRLAMKRRYMPQLRHGPVTHARVDGDYLHYALDLDTHHVFGPMDQHVNIWDPRLQITWRGQTNVAPFSVDPALIAGRRIRVRTRFGALMSGQVEPHVNLKGNVAFEQVPETGIRARFAAAHGFVQRVLASLRRRTQELPAHPALLRRAYTAFRRLPVVPGLTVFESHMGLQYSDNPRYVYEAARRVGFDRLGLTPVWSTATDGQGFPEEAPTVRRMSLRYAYLLARAQYWVDNQGFPRVFDKRPETTYLQTWHGTPLKTMGWDEPGLAALSGAARRAHERGVARWDHLVAPSEYFVDTFARSYRYDGKLLRVGYPRNDPLVTAAHDPDQVREAKLRLGLPLDRTIVLYAPTFRDADRRAVAPHELPLDFKAFGAALRDRAYLLVRTHYLTRFVLSREFWPFAFDVSGAAGHHDMTELLVAADVLVTDYSSTMFDFANTGRPMVFFAPDYDDYVRSERGTYFSLAAEAPGPLVSTTAELVDVLSDVDALAREHAERLAAWRRRFCEYDSGHAADDVVAAVFGQGGTR